VGITAGLKEVPGRNACDRRHTYCTTTTTTTTTIIIITITIIIHYCCYIIIIIISPTTVAEYPGFSASGVHK